MLERRPLNHSLNQPTTLFLMWYSLSTSDWGKACTDANNVYKVYFGTTNPPPYVGMVSNTNYFVSNLSGNTVYYWRVVANNMNGAVAGNGPAGEVWSFRTLPPTWWQTVGGDVAGTVISSKIPSGVATPYINSQSY